MKRFLLCLALAGFFGAGSLNAAARCRNCVKDEKPLNKIDHKEMVTHKNGSRHGVAKAVRNAAEANQGLKHSVQDR